MPQCIVQFQKVVPEGGLKRWSSWWPAILTYKQVSIPSSALYPRAAAPQVPSLTTVLRHQRDLPGSRVSSRPHTVRKCPGTSSAVAQWEPQFHPAARAQSVALHVAYRGREDHCFGTAVLSLATAGEFTTVKQTPVNLF